MTKTIEEILQFAGIDIAIDQQLAYGYTFDRDTISIIWDSYHKEIHYFKNDELTKYSTWEPEVFFVGIKRFYKAKTHPAIINLFDLFGRPLSLV